MSDLTSQIQPTPPGSAPDDITVQRRPAAPPSEQPDYAPAAFTLPRARRLRLWPGVVLIALMWLGMRGPGWVMPGQPMQFYGLFFGPMIAAGLLLVWWVFFSRLGWWDRLLVPLACAAVAAGANALYHPSFAGFGLILTALPATLTAWVGWLLVSSFLRWPVRRVGLYLVLLLGWGFFTLVRFDGVYGDMKMTLAWRWTKTAEDLFIADLAGRKKSAEATALAEEKMSDLKPGDWPGFRGAQRDGQLQGVRLATDWDKKPPKELWRHKVGPGWGSFAVIGDRFYTQEQRGGKETVVCYSVETGDEVWAHEDTTRFTEIVAGPGPRATPTYHDGKLYAFGATGILNCLDAATGKPQWTRNVVADVRAMIPQWGFASSPLVAHGLVSVFAGGPNGKSVVAYDANSGEPAWAAGDGQLSYCSPQLSTLDGIEQILIATDQGLTAFHPKTGEVLWKHNAPTKDQARVTQPAVVGASDVLLGTGMGGGTRRLHLDHSEDGWSEKEVWTTKAIKPYFNDLVIYDGHLYGFDTGGFFTCVNLDDGKAQWRERGYGSGQVLLLADQGLLLVMAETGEVALVEAKPGELKELGRFKAFEDKTWNHPVVAHGKLFVRNGAEMACYQLTKDTGK